MKPYFLLLFLMFLFISCDKGEVNPLTDFHFNKNKWESLLIDSYTYTFQIFCFCTPNYTLPKEVEVVDGQITNVDGVSYDDEIHLGLLSIPQLFDTIEKAKNNDFAIEVVYHQVKGYPTSVSIDEIQMVADDEVSYFITDFRD